jgi:hypothetical protein
MKPTIIYTTSGDWMATCVGDYIWDTQGNWIAWVDGDDVYTLDGELVGQLSRDNRILRKRTIDRRRARTDIPPRPERPPLPGRAPLPPMFSELSYEMIDVLEEDPDIFKRTSDLRPDMD